MLGHFFMSLNLGRKCSIQKWYIEILYTFCKIIYPWFFLDIWIFVLSMKRKWWYGNDDNSILKRWTPKYEWTKDSHPLNVNLNFEQCCRSISFPDLNMDPLFFQDSGIDQDPLCLKWIFMMTIIDNNEEIWVNIKKFQ